MIHLKQICFNIFGLTLAALNFSIFIFSTGIKFTIRHPVVLLGILILLEQVDDFVQLSLGVFLKTDSYVFINTWNTEFYIPLLLRQNEWRHKIWHWLKLGCSLNESKCWQIRKLSLWNGFVLLYLFLYKMFILRLATMSP